MNREEFVTKVQDLVNQAYLHDIDSKYYNGMMHEAEKWRYPITLAEFLGWEEGVEYRRGGDILKVEGNHLLDKRPNGKFHNTNCSTAELIDLRNATKCEPLYYAKIKGWELVNTGKYYFTQNYPSNRLYITDDLDPEFSMFTKAEWAKLGITSENADFERVEE